MGADRVFRDDFGNEGPDPGEFAEPMAIDEVRYPTRAVPLAEWREFDQRTHPSVLTDAVVSLMFGEIVDAVAEAARQERRERRRRRFRTRFVPLVCLIAGVSAAAVALALGTGWAITAGCTVLSRLGWWS